MSAQPPFPVVNAESAQDVLRVAAEHPGQMVWMMPGRVPPRMVDQMLDQARAIDAQRQSGGAGDSLNPAP